MQYLRDQFKNIDYLTAPGAGLGCRMVKVELLDTYKAVVVPGIEKNDVALIVGMVFKR